MQIHAAIVLGSFVPYKLGQACTALPLAWIYFFLFFPRSQSGDTSVVILAAAAPVARRPSSRKALTKGNDLIVEATNELHKSGAQRTRKRRTAKDLHGPRKCACVPCGRSLVTGAQRGPSHCACGPSCAATLAICDFSSIETL